MSEINPEDYVTVAQFTKLRQNMERQDRIGQDVQNILDNIENMNPFGGESSVHNGEDEEDEEEVAARAAREARERRNRVRGNREVVLMVEAEVVFKETITQLNLIKGKTGTRILVKPACPKTKSPLTNYHQT